ncbi:hypothetical protein FOZ60_015056 [Perkinsus olseni]|uniref:DJ-1/PfpI domain-containing protein n=1 Tax=Perkinsus olseni TaxID=32597 RepID=A0A7J6N692_PEROL|nr:hypothetical protein FOZ60_015056 [Perkinsus olseni]
MPEKGDLNKEFQLWAERIEKENKVNAKITDSPFTLARPPEVVANKPNQETFGTHRKASVVDTGDLLDNLRKAAAFPRDKFLLPQTTAQDLGWLLGDGKGLLSKGMCPTTVTTGLGNWRRHFPRPAEREDTHHRGYVTMLGEFDYPTDMQRVVRDSRSVPDLAEASPFRRSSKKNRSKRMASLRFLGQAVEDLPGDIHIKKHEWAYLRTQLRDEPEGAEDSSSRRRDGSSVNSAQSEPSRLSVLSGCGHLDGTEIREAVFTLTELSRAKAKFQCFAPDKRQMHVVNHSDGSIDSGSKRDVLIEASRIGREGTLPLTELKAADYDALMFPGGFGAAKNLSNFAIKGSAMTVDPEVERALTEFHQNGRPIGLVCIAPVLGAKVLKAEVTMGSDKISDEYPNASAAEAVEEMGGKHFNTKLNEAHVDVAKKVVTSAAYMNNTAPLHEIQESVAAMVTETLKLIDA